MFLIYISLLQPDIMHRPLLLRSRGGEGCVRGTAGWVEAAAVGSAATADGELALVNGLGDLLFLPLGGAVASRVEGGHQEDCHDHHASLEDHEGDFLVGKLAFEAVCEFGDTEAGTDQDGHESGREDYQNVSIGKVSRGRRSILQTKVLYPLTWAVGGSTFPAAQFVARCRAKSLRTLRKNAPTKTLKNVMLTIWNARPATMI